MDDQRQDNQLEPIYNSSVPMQDIPLKTFQEQWMIETGGERGSGRSVLVARHDEDNIVLIVFFNLITLLCLIYYF